MHVTGEYELVGELTVEAYRTLPVDHLWGGYDREIRDVASRVRGAHVLVAKVTGRDGQFDVFGSVARAGEVVF